MCFHLVIREGVRKVADVEINDLASIGVIRDVEGYQLPPEAWTYGLNMHFGRDGVERIAGREQIFGTPGAAPHFALPVQSASQTFWLYTSLTKGYVYDGSTHTDITRAVGGDYTAPDTKSWNGVLFGGVPILNNGADVPQYWASLNPATQLDALPNWTSTVRAKVMRSLGPYLIALNITKSGTTYPHMVKWSHPADPGSVPSSWDETDPTKDAGERDLPDVQAGVIQDGLPLQGRFFIYKEGSIWRMSLVGGTFIFNFDTLSELSGILAPRCVTVTGDGTRHVVATQDDIIVHNGNSIESILDERFKRYLFNNVDSASHENSFMFTDPFNNEVYFCYPESGSEQPNKAIIWNYKLGQRGAISECEINFRNVATGNIEAAIADTWSTVTGTWDSKTDPWSTNIRRSLIACATDTTKFLKLNTGTLNDGADYTGTLQREGLSIIGRKRSGEWIVDFASRKQVNRVWIKASGGPINFRLGFQSLPGGTVTWGAVQSFDPATQTYVDVTGSGKAVAIEFSAIVPFRILGYKLEIVPISRF